MTPNQLSPADRAVYDESILKGNTPRFAMMVALRSPPASQTDADYWRRKPKTIGQICDESPQYGAMLVHSLKSKGVSVSMEAHYDPLGADDLGDTTNYFDPTHGRKEWESRMKDKAAKSKPKKAVPLKDSLIREEVVKRVQQDPGILTNKRKKAELRDKIIDEHARKKRPVKPIDTLL